MKRNPKCKHTREKLVGDEYFPGESDVQILKYKCVKCGHIRECPIY